MGPRGLNALFDTNVLIDYLKGSAAARDELARYEAGAISLVTWMEVMVGVVSQEEEGIVRRFLASFRVLGIDVEVAEAAVAVRREYRMRLPDAIIFASARVHGLLLVTRNTRDFPRNHPGVRVPYEL